VDKYEFYLDVLRLRLGKASLLKN